ncbi:MAG TPA: zinc-binding dehydrogenase [Propionibacteriaceae bacterium]|jgi:alcohol dehydrogenase, propanol-preferring|nr:zinc-binding dehydrogenase [Propionibacteriaceae bacterium]
MAIQFAALTGAEVVAIGRSQDHLQVALELGATRAINSSDRSTLDEFEAAADAVITFAPSDVVTEQALRVLKWGGTLVIGR